MSRETITCVRYDLKGRRARKCLVGEIKSRKRVIKNFRQYVLVNKVLLAQTDWIAIHFNLTLLRRQIS